MPGIFGFLQKRPSDAPGKLLGHMAEALVVRGRDVVGTYSDEQIHLGSVQLEGFHALQQPVWNADHTICAVAAGEIFGNEPLIEILQDRGHVVPDNDFAGIVTYLYQETGSSFIKSLNGAFSLVIWDSINKRLILANDRLGYYPLYYTQTPDRFAFSSGIRGLLADSTLPRRVNLRAMAEFLTFDHVLGTHTFVDNISLLPPGSLLTVSGDRAVIESYWQLMFPGNYMQRSEGEYQEEFLRLLRQAARRQTPEQPAGILLSGGLDSRFVLALLMELPVDSSISAITFGNPGCDDFRYAKELTAKLHCPHKFFELRPDYLVHHAEQGVKLSDGMQNVVHMHTLDTLSEQAKLASIFFKGFLGDALMGYFSFRDLSAHYSTDDLVNVFMERYPLVFKPDLHSELFSPAAQTQVLGSVEDALRSELVFGKPCDLAADHFFQFDLLQRQRRMTLNGVQLVRSRAYVRTPFYDNDVIDFMLQVPQGYRLDRYLMKSVFIKTFPELAKVPYTETGYPIMPCLRDQFMRLGVHVRWRLRAAGLQFVGVPRKRQYASYGTWFQGVLRPWVESILLSDRFRERNVFNPVYVRQLVEEHMAGHNHYQKLGALISIELWYRQFID